MSSVSNPPFDPIQMGVLKSSAAVVNGFSQLLSQGLLDPDSAIIPEPTGFINILMSVIGEKSATAFFEQQMYKNEALPSTALLVSSLIRQLDSSLIGEYFGNPANLTFVLGISESDLLSKGVIQPNGDLMMTVDKNATMQIGSFPQFTLDYNINIIVSNPYTSNYTIYAAYDVSQMDSTISPIVTPYLPSRRILYNGLNYFAMYINIRQYNRSVTSVDVSGSDYRKDYYFSYANEIMGFEVYYTPPGSSTTPQLLVGQPMGISNPTGYNFAILDQSSTYGNGGQIQISFSRNPSAFQPTTGNLTFVIYNTQGSKGNFALPNLSSSVPNIQFIPNQNKNIPSEAAYNGIIPIISIKSTSSQGGRDQMSIDQLRAYIENQNRSGGKIISPGEIAYNAQRVGMTASQTRNDPLGIEWRMSGRVITPDSIVVPTIMNNLNMLIGEGTIPVTSFPLYNSGNDCIVIPPGTIFNINGNPNPNSNPNDLYYVPINLITLNSDYINNYNSSSGISDYVFPYLIQTKPSGNLQTNIYDTSVNQNYGTDFTYFNPNSQDRASITSVSIFRNAMVKDITTGFGIYNISFQVNVGDNIIASLNNNPTPIICKIILTSSTDSTQQFLANASIAKNSDGSLNVVGNLITFNVNLYTDDTITDVPAIVINNSSIVPVPFVINPSGFYPIEATQNIQIFTILQTIGSVARPSSSYDYILTQADMNSGYYISTVYEADGLVLFEDITNSINIQPDISISQPTFSRYSNTLYSTYTSTLYATNPDGTYMIDTTSVIINGLPVENQSFITLHNINEFVYSVYIQSTPGILMNQNFIVNQSQFVPNATVSISGWSFVNSIYGVNINISNGVMEVLFYLIGTSVPSEVSINLTNNTQTFTSVPMINAGNGIYQSIININENSTPSNMNFTFSYNLSSVRSTPITINTTDVFMVTPNIIHNVGDLIYDQNNNPIVSVPGNVTLILRDVPLYDRIFSIDRFEDILTGYQSLMDEVTALAANIPDGTSLYSGVWQTTGMGLWRLKSDNSILNDLALSFSIGFKLIQNAYGVDPNYVSTQISNNIVSYVNSFTGYEFSVMKMLDYIQTLIPSIDYFEFYDMNIYGIDHSGSSNAQTIFVNATDIPNASNQALSITYSAKTQMMTDPTTSQTYMSNIIFTPAINIKQLT